MFNQKIFSCVKITSDDSIVLSKSKQVRKVQIYSTNGINGIKTFLRISKNEPNGNYLEYDMKNLYSIHKKLVEEGKATFVFREQKGHSIIQGTFSSTLQLKGLQEIFQVTNVFLYQCHPQNLKSFIDMTIQYLMSKKTKTPNNGCLQSQKVKKNSLIHNNNKNEIVEKIQQKKGRIILNKRKIQDIYKDGQFILNQKPNNTQKENLQQKQKWIYLILGCYTFPFLQNIEKKQLSLSCKYLACSYDSQKLTYKVNNENPPLFLIKQLLQRFHNLQKLKFTKRSNLKLQKDFFNYLKLSRLKKLDIAKCGGLCEKFINQFLNASPNLISLKMPQQNLQYSNILYLNKMNQRLKVLKLKNNEYQCKDTISKQHAEFLIMYFKENQDLQKLHINKIQDKLFSKINQHCQNFTKLINLEIDTLYLDQRNFSEFFQFVQKNLIYTYDNDLYEFNDQQIQTIHNTFLCLKNIKTFYFGEWIQDHVLETILQVFQKNLIFLKKIKIQRIDITDSYLEKILQQQNQIEELDIYKCQNINGHCLNIIDQKFKNLKVLKVKLDDYRLKFLKQQLEKNNLIDCKIIRVIQLIYNDLIL